MNVYDNVRKACKEQGISINKLEQELGFARSSIAKFQTSVPGGEKLNMIAQRLGCSVDYLLNGMESSSETDVDVARILKNTLNQLEAKQEALMFDGQVLDNETRELLIISLENSVRIAKAANATGNADTKRKK